MDLFGSIFSNDGASQPQPSDSDSDSDEHHTVDGASVSTSSNPSTTWSFGSLIKTLATKSESVIHNYRRDLEELGSGLKKETSVIRDVASRAVDNLPSSLDVGASVAQESLESVGQVIDDIGIAVWKSTAKIISRGTETILASDFVSRDCGSSNGDIIGFEKFGHNSSARNFEIKRYSRFDAQLLGIQRDVNTYLEEPDDLENYRNWKLGFVLEEKEKEIEDLVEDNEDVRAVYRTVVPSRIDREVFWCRYYFRVYKLKQAEEARVKLVKRAIDAEEEDFSWDLDDDEIEESKELQLNDDYDGASITEKKDSDGVENGKTREGNLESVDKKVTADGSADSDISVISSQRLSSPGADELGWDEIEDIGTIEETKDSTSRNRHGIDLHKRRSLIEEEEDLGWDIEDEDEPATS